MTKGSDQHLSAGMLPAISCCPGMAVSLFPSKKLAKGFHEVKKCSLAQGIQLCCTSTQVMSFQSFQALILIRDSTDMGVSLVLSSRHTAACHSCPQGSCDRPQLPAGLTLLSSCSDQPGSSPAHLLTNTCPHQRGPGSWVKLQVRRPHLNHFHHSQESCSAPAEQSL